MGETSNYFLTFLFQTFTFTSVFYCIRTPHPPVVSQPLFQAVRELFLTHSLCHTPVERQMFFGLLKCYKMFWKGITDSKNIVKPALMFNSECLWMFYCQLNTVYIVLGLSIPLKVCEMVFKQSLTDWQQLFSRIFQIFQKTFFNPVSHSQMYLKF